MGIRKIKNINMGIVDRLRCNITEHNAGKKSVRFATIQSDAHKIHASVEHFPPIYTEPVKSFNKA
jgi:hypothetical protein